MRGDAKERRMVSWELGEKVMLYKDLPLVGTIHYLPGSKLRCRRNSYCHERAMCNGSLSGPHHLSIYQAGSSTMMALLFHRRPCPRLGVDASMLPRTIPLCRNPMATQVHPFWLYFLWATRSVKLLRQASQSPLHEKIIMIVTVLFCLRGNGDASTLSHPTDLEYCAESRQVLLGVRWWSLRWRLVPLLKKDRTTWTRSAM